VDGAEMGLGSFRKMAVFSLAQAKRMPAAARMAFTKTCGENSPHL